MSTPGECKDKGNKFYVAKEYDQAVEWYGKGVDMDPKNHVLYSNRAAAYIGMKRYDLAFKDTSKSIEVKPDWMKGYYRQAMALSLLGLHEKAAEVCKRGLKAVPGNGDLKRKLTECQKAMRSSPTNDNLVASIKETGNAEFKRGMYEKAVEHYSRALQILEVTGKPDTEKLPFWNNRAACNLQIHAHRHVINDTTNVLNIQPENVKALMRRGLAYEYIEKWKKALEDMQKARELDPSAKQASDGVTRIKKLLHQFT
mmetsp:Transcript_21140/g.23602  ORF Transcript_21140/g.23602 Transcript_21140/m.23602 type:complete len:256 (-) Transcript_21140:74-841(-)|eukprot:CAMPEP_0168512800 /NCGR_PEP_ID=MMETSP0405-20121227/3036_1 /TAXON_ID=498012 /ORGANISM="Trichosphaerium sp, Strain Am-I-7 wt" /LENGTH=255 /DNA_ID=CAMNT_0008531417 /DNA_START=118 /DNA_END=885 /DNA_ORIENTATION=+